MRKAVLWRSLFCALAVLLSVPAHAQQNIEYSLCGLDFRSISEHDHLPPDAVYTDTHASAGARAEDVVKRLSFDEKLALTGGVEQFYFPGVERLGIPAVYFADATQGIHEKAICIKVEKSTAFPSGQALAATWDRALAYDYARAISEECRAWGVGVLLGPGLNLYRNSEGGRNFEYFGEDPYLVGQMGVHYVQGLQSLGTIATIKHFVGNEQEFVRHDADVQVDSRALHELYLAPFKAAIEDGHALAVMTGNNFVNGHPGAADTPLSQGVLRDTYAFKGIIMSDWANSLYWPTRQGEELTSGHSLLMQDNHLFARYVADEVAAHPEKKAQIERDLDKMVAANLFTFFSSGIYDRPYRDPSLVAAIDSHQAVALRTAEEAITLLKNQDNLLPLAPETGRTIAVVGTPEALSVYGGKGSGAVAGYNHVDFMAGLKQVYGDHVTLVNPSDTSAIRAADVVLCVVNKHASEGIDVPYDNPELDAFVNNCATLNPNVVVVYSGGNGMAMPWLPRVKAIVFAYFLGQQRGTALANVLSGKTNPSGKLPYSIEKDFKDSPAFDYNKLPDGTFGWAGGRSDSLIVQKHAGLIPIRYTEGVYIGYRWYEKKHIEPLFPFGYGLSYTSFAYSNLKAPDSHITDSAAAQISFTITNTGHRAGAEIAQLYIHDVASNIDRPIKELKNFERVYLQPGESNVVRLSVSRNDVAFWNTATGQWQSNHGSYEILVGSSSADIRSKLLLSY